MEGLNCPKCLSNSISYDSSIKIIKKDSIGIRKTIEYKKIYKCKCFNCNNKYNVEYDESYNVYREPYKTYSETGDMLLIGSFNSNDPNQRNYKLIKYSITPFDAHGTKLKADLLICEGTCFPIMISKETSLEIENEINDFYNIDIEPTEDKRLINGTLITRSGGRQYTKKI